MPKTKKELNAELVELKKKYDGISIFQLTTYIDEKEDEERTIYLRKPTRLVRTAAEKVTVNDAWKGVETFLRGMWIGGDDIDEIIKNDDALMIAGGEVVEIIKLRAGNVQKV